MTHPLTRDIVTIGKVKWHLELFSTLRDAMEYIERAPTTWRSLASKTERPAHDWDLNAGWQGALKMAHDGWHEGGQDLSQRLAALPPTDQQPHKRWDVSGHSLNVGRALSGNPLHMRTKARNQGQKQGISLVMNLAAMWNVDARYMANYGLAVAAYVESLERQNIPVEVIAIWTTSTVGGGGNGYAGGWYVKRAHEALNTADMAFSIGHPASLRRIAFALAERSSCPSLMAHGMPVETPEGIMERLAPTSGIALNGRDKANQVARTVEATQEYLAQEIERAGL